MKANKEQTEQTEETEKPVPYKSHTFTFGSNYPAYKTLWRNGKRVKVRIK